MTIEKQKMEELKKALLEERTKLEKDLGQIAVKADEKVGEYTPALEDIGKDREDNATEVEQFADNLPVELALENKLKNVIEALEKMEKENYGICENCGKEITLERLEINPSAKTCINCK